MRTSWKRTRALLASILAVAAAVALLSGCGGKADKNDAAPSIEELGTKIEQAADLKEMKQRDGEKLKKLYKIDPDNLDGFILYTSTSNVRADELAVIKLKDAWQTEQVQKNIEQRIAAQKIKFKDYRPEEYFLVENHVLKSKGPFVFFAVSKEAKQMEQAFDGAF